MQVQDRQQLRRKAFKKGVDHDDARRRREDEAVVLRKQKKDEHLMKKRLLTENKDPQISGPSTGSSKNITIRGKPLIARSMKSIPELVLLLSSSKWDEKFFAVQQIRMLLSDESCVPIREVLRADVTHKFVQFLAVDENPDLQFEAAWVITNLCSGTAEQTRAVVHAGAIPACIELILKSSHDNVREQAIWALGNIAGDDCQNRDLVLHSGGLPPVLTSIFNSSKLTVCRQAIWTVSNFLRGKPEPAEKYVRLALPALAMLLRQASDVEVLADCCWALCYASDGDTQRTSRILDTGLARRLIGLLGHTSQLVQLPALRTVACIVSSEESHAQAMIEAGCISHLKQLLCHPNKAIRKETSWMVSNITAGNSEQIAHVIEAGIIPILVDHLKHADFNFKKEAMYALSNVAQNGNLQQLDYLIQSSCVEQFCEMLQCCDDEVIMMCLQALVNLLAVGRHHANLLGRANQVCFVMEECSGLDLLETLQQRSDDIGDGADSLLQEYFLGGEEEEEEEVLLDESPDGCSPPHTSFFNIFLTSKIKKRKFAWCIILIYRFDFKTE